MTTILVAEDDDGVRELILVALRRRGYTVLGTANGNEAMQVLAGDGADVDLLVSDVNMPGMGGLELLAYARRIRPDMPAILASGTNRWELPPERLEGDVTLLEKPFSVADFAQAVEAALKPEAAMPDSLPATKTAMGAEGDDGQVFGR